MQAQADPVAADQRFVPWAHEIVQGILGRIYRLYET